jgi:hypothetical protein
LWRAAVLAVAVHLAKVLVAAVVRVVYYKVQLH